LNPMASDLQQPTVVVRSEVPELWKLPDSLNEFVLTGDEEMVMEILTLFQQDSAERLRELNLAVANHDRDRVRKQAHTLKGAALQVGAMSMAALCLEIERQVICGEDARLVELGCQVWECFDQTCRVMFAANPK